MTIRTTKHVSPRTAMPAVEADERHQADVDGFIERNRDELNASIRRSREEVGKGIRAARTVDEIIADGRKRHNAA